MKIFVFIVCWLLGPLSVMAEQSDLQKKAFKKVGKKLSQGISQNQKIESKGLVIQTKIQEPALLYLIERPELTLDVPETKRSYTDKIYTPLLEDLF